MYSVKKFILKFRITIIMKNILPISQNFGKLLILQQANTLLLLTNDR